MFKTVLDIDISVIVIYLYFGACHLRFLLFISNLNFMDKYYLVPNGTVPSGRDIIIKWGIPSLPVIKLFEIVYEIAAELRNICSSNMHK